MTKIYREILDPEKELNKTQNKIREFGITISEKYCKDFLNEMIDFVNPLLPLTSNDVLTAFANASARLTALLIVMTKTKISDRDDSGFTLREVRDTIIDSVDILIGLKKSERVEIKKEDYKPTLSEESPKIKYANVLTHKNIGDVTWMYPTLFSTLEEAQNYTHSEYVVIKTIEVKL